MSVIVKGMKMPEGCLSCGFHDDESNYCKAKNEFVNFVIMRHSKDADCPLIELPEHGRLIDADAYSDFLTDIIKKDGYENLKIDDLTTVAEVLEAVVSDLTGTGPDGFDNAPTIIEAEGDEK